MAKRKMTELELLEHQAAEHSVKILVKEYEKTGSGFTLNALYFSLKTASTDKSTGAINIKALNKLLHSISEATLQKLVTYGQGIGEQIFPELIQWELLASSQSIDR
ncbi:MAG: hypothetical protein IJY90_02320 [Clostridia bacterium]|nr:hypothetical protein [Clostridia bacterium]